MPHSVVNLGDAIAAIDHALSGHYNVLKSMRSTEENAAVNLKD